MSDLWIVVLNWNGLAETRECLASLEGCAARILVVDNGSTDGSAEALAARPDIDLLRLDANLGFGAGMNRGVAKAVAAGARQVLLLNNDARLAPDTLARLVAALEADPEAAAATPTLYAGSPPGRERRWYAGGRIRSWAGVIAHDTRPPDGRTHPVSFASGCCLLVRTRDWETLGGFREDYFLYFEDVELCWRWRKAGKRLLHASAAEAWHGGGASTGSQHLKAPDLDYYDFRNGLAFLREQLPAPRRWTALAYLAAVRVPRKLARILATSRPRGPALAAALAGLRDGFAGRLGPRPTEPTRQRVTRREPAGK